MTLAPASGWRPRSAVSWRGGVSGAAISGSAISTASPLRSTSSLALLPIGKVARRKRSDGGSATSWPLIAITTSPTCSPAFSAEPPL